MLEELLKKKKILVDGHEVHVTSTITENGFHAKWSEKRGLMICPEDIDTIDIKLKDKKSDKKSDV